jgi:hypothetical protein
VDGAGVQKGKEPLAIANFDRIELVFFNHLKSNCRIGSFAFVHHELDHPSFYPFHFPDHDGRRSPLFRELAMVGEAAMPLLTLLISR